MNSSLKGKIGERELKKFFCDHGFDAQRGQQYAGCDGDGNAFPDVIVRDLPWHVECKRCEKGNPYLFLDQSIKDCPEGKMPTVFHRRNGQEWMFICRATDILKFAKHSHTLNTD